MAFELVEEAMQEALAEGVFPGAVLLVRQGDAFFYLRAFGSRSLVPQVAPMREDTIFDVASLTKPLATSVAVMLLVKEGKIRLDDRVARFVPNFSVHGKAQVTLRQLLAHCSGLPAWKPYYKEVLAEERRGGRVNFLGTSAAKAFVYQFIERERVEAEPGTRTLYSDIGFILLGAVIEQLSGMSLDRFCQERIFRPLGMRSTGFVDLGLLRARRLEPITEMIAPTEECPWRQKLLWGEVHDDNAYAMGGVAGHAGLFSSARDIDTLLCCLEECYYRVGGMIPQRLIREFWTKDPTVPGSTWCLGWDTPSPQGSSAGRHFSAESVGHLGFTGCSVWIDLAERCHVVLLSNRVHPRRDNDKIREFRPRLHDLIREALG